MKLYFIIKFTSFLHLFEREMVHGEHLEPEQQARGTLIMELPHFRLTAV